MTDKRFKRPTSCRARIRENWRITRDQLKTADQDTLLDDVLEITAQADYSVKVLFSTGGPADWLELGCKRTPYGHALDRNRVTYHFADWYDHAEINITRQADLDLIDDRLGWLLETMDFTTAED